jgi:hypothetical protein
MLYEKVATTPIAKGGGVTGLLVFLTKGVSYERLISERPPVTVVFSDVRGSDCKVDQQGQGTAAPFHQPGYDDPFAPILLQQAKQVKAGEKLYYSVVEKIGQGTRPIMALIELGVADELDTNDSVINFCAQLTADGHEDAFENLKILYPPQVWQEFLKEARRKNLKFPDQMAELDFMGERFREQLKAKEAQRSQ